MLKNAQPLDLIAIYDTKCMSELLKSRAKTAKLDPSEHFLTNVKQSWSKKRSESAQERKKVVNQAFLFAKIKKFHALRDPKRPCQSLATP